MLALRAEERSGGWRGISVLTMIDKEMLRAVRRWTARLAGSVATLAALALLPAGTGATHGAAQAAGLSAAAEGRLFAQVQPPPNPDDPQDPESEDPEEEEVPIPPNLLEDEPIVPPAAPPDSLGAPAPADSAAAGADTLRFVPNVPAEPETLFSDPGKVLPGPGDKPPPADPIVERRPSRGGILGLTPIVVLLGLAIIHVLVVRSID